MSSIDVLKDLLNDYACEFEVDQSEALAKAIESLEKVNLINRNLVLVDEVALKMVLNVLDRAGKFGASKAFRESCIDPIQLLEK